MKKKRLTLATLVLTIVIAIAPTMALTASSQVSEEFRMITLTQEARDIVLYDFDYLVDMIMQTAPTRNIFYRRFDISMEDFFAQWRQVIYDKTPMPSLAEVLMAERWVDVPEDDLHLAADYLLSVLWQIRIEIEMIGHMSPQPFMGSWANYGLALYMMQYEAYLAPEMIDLWIAEYDLSPEEIEKYLQVIQSVVALGRLHYDIFNTPSALWLYGFDPAMIDPEMSMDAMAPMNPNNVTTNIIEPGRIAYLRIASFFNNIELDQSVLFPFFEEVQNYEHLIIDLRGNGGGNPTFMSNVLTMLIDESVYFIHPEFFIASELTAAHFENPMSFSATDYNTWDEILPIADFMQNQNMPMFNQDDFALLDYAVVWRSEFAPAENNIPFGGEVWLLIDGESFSAAELAAKVSLGTGFATIVGEPTGRITATVYTFAALPNTGILFRVDLGYTVNPCGRSLEEYGVIPQIPNAPGMDALETVLAIINDTSETDLFAAVPRRMVDGVTFVSVRLAAYAHGYAVEWDNANQSVIVTKHDGSTVVLAVSTNNIFNDNGTVFVPIEYIASIF